MILKELASSLDKIFHKSLAADWDRVGLQIGNERRNINKILVTLDLDDEAIEEAVSNNADLVISHHPIIFDPIDSVTDSTDTGKKVMRLVENRISAYAVHSNYDIMDEGLSDILAQKLGLKDIKSTGSHKKQWYKFVIFSPPGSQEKIRKVICGSGGGKFKDYSCCTFSSPGTATFLPEKDAHPYIGNTGELSIVDEVRMECIVDEENLRQLVESVIKVHPYEEPAYDIYRIENQLKNTGFGRYGRIEKPVVFKEYIKVLKKNFQIADIGWIDRGTGNTMNRLINKVAVAGGSVNSITEELAGIDCDLVIAGEISYHNAIKISESGKIVAVIGHGTSEKYAIDGIYNRLVCFFKDNNIDMDVFRSKSGYWIWRYDIG